MDARKAERLAVMRTVIAALRSPDFGKAFPGTRPGEEVPIIVALDDDPVSLFFDEVARYDRLGYLIVPITSDGEDEPAEMAMITFRPAEPCESPVHDDECPIAPHSEIGMLVEYVRRVRGPARFAVRNPDCEIPGEIELTDTDYASATA